MEPSDAGTIGAAVTSGGAAATATAAAACCLPVLSPLLVAALGASGAAWVTGLRPYSPYLLLVGLALLGYAFWRVYGRRGACDPDARSSPLRRWLARITLGVLWLSTLVWVAAVAAHIAFF